MTNRFYHGEIYELVTDCPKEVHLFKATPDGNNRILVVPKKLVEEVASELFAVGDRVQSTVGGNDPFTGTVTGFEHQNNQVICTSDKTSGRVRYSYKPHHLKKFNRITLEVGNSYVDESNNEFLCIKSGNRIALLNNNNCQIEYWYDHDTIDNKMGLKELCTEQMAFILEVE